MEYNNKVKKFLKVRYLDYINKLLTEQSFEAIPKNINFNYKVIRGNYGLYKFKSIYKVGCYIYNIDVYILELVQYQKDSYKLIDIKINGKSLENKFEREI